MALPVRTLPIAMIQPTFGALLVPAVGGAALLTPGVGTARRAAIALPPITVGTNPEHCLATLAATNALPENHFAMNRHPPTQANFDNDNGSCQGRTSLNGALLMKVAKPEPRRLNGGVLLPPSKPQYNFSLECFDADD
jgi:hypothetical protein